MKEKILIKLKENSSEYISGEDLSEVLGVSRTAVWKYINELRKEGYKIISSTNKGYKLMPVSDIINEYELSYDLKTAVLGRNIHFFPVIDSTNNYAKQIANEGCSEGTLVIADCQTSGRGRLGRAWESQGGKGIWMSIVLRPPIAPEDVQIITLAASVAVTNAIKHSTGIPVGIKWPNDIILDGKKVCGILTEMNSEMDRVNYLVLGIGINVNHRNEDFPGELEGTAVSLLSYAQQHGIPLDKPQDDILCRSELVKGILLELESIYCKIKNSLTAEIIEEWREHSATLGKTVRIIARNMEYTGVARDITHDGKLVVDCEDGVTREIVSGEVSVRGIMGYV